jgi:hypothetical protein
MRADLVFIPVGQVRYVETVWATVVAPVALVSIRSKAARCSLHMDVLITSAPACASLLPLMSRWKVLEALATVIALH